MQAWFITFSFLFTVPSLASDYTDQISEQLIRGRLEGFLNELSIYINEIMEESSPIVRKIELGLDSIDNLPKINNEAYAAKVQELLDEISLEVEKQNYSSIVDGYSSKNTRRGMIGGTVAGSVGGVLFMTWLLYFCYALGQPVNYVWLYINSGASLLCLVLIAYTIYQFSYAGCGYTTLRQAIDDHDLENNNKTLCKLTVEENVVNTIALFKKLVLNIVNNKAGSSEEDNNKLVLQYVSRFNELHDEMQLLITKLTELQEPENSHG